MKRATATSAAADFDALERLRDDHRQIDELLATLLSHAKDDEHGVRETRRVVGLVGTLLRVHDELIDQVLMPPLRASEGADAAALSQASASAARSREEFDRLEAMSPGDDGFGDALRRLARLLRERFERDERELFAVARDAAVDWPRLSEQMATRQEALLSAGSGPP